MQPSVRRTHKAGAAISPNKILDRKHKQIVHDEALQDVMKIPTDSSSSDDSKEDGVMRDSKYMCSKCGAVEKKETFVRSADVDYHDMVMETQLFNGSEEDDSSSEEWELPQIKPTPAVVESGLVFGPVVKAERILVVMRVKDKPMAVRSYIRGIQKDELSNTYTSVTVRGKPTDDVVALIPVDILTRIVEDKSEKCPVTDISKYIVRASHYPGSGQTRDIIITSYVQDYKSWGGKTVKAVLGSLLHKLADNGFIPRATWNIRSEERVDTLLFHKEVSDEKVIMVRAIINGYMVDGIKFGTRWSKK